jgi:hypothetical protein
MISDPDVARRVRALMLETGAKLDASVADVQASCPLPEFERYRREVGQIMARMLLDIIDPALRPASGDQAQGTQVT